MNNWKSIHEEIEDLILEELGTRIEPWQATELTEKILTIIGDQLHDTIFGD